MERNYYKTYQKYMIFFAAVIVSLIILLENRVRSSAWKIRMSEGRMESGLNEKLKRRKKKPWSAHGPIPSTLIPPLTPSQGTESIGGFIHEPKLAHIPTAPAWASFQRSQKPVTVMSHLPKRLLRRTKQSNFIQHHQATGPNERPTKRRQHLCRNRDPPPMLVSMDENQKS